jgi:molybdenum cofactor biosynthesis enzyme MoaA
MTAPEPRPLPPEGPFCARCQTYRVMTPGQECVVCLDEKGRP